MPDRKRYAIKFAGPVSRRIVAWLQLLIPVLQQAPEDVEITVEITHREAPDGQTPQGDPG